MWSVGIFEWQLKILKKQASFLWIIVVCDNVGQPEMSQHSQGERVQSSIAELTYVQQPIYDTFVHVSYACIQGQRQ